MSKELWKDVAEFKGCYQVSNLGRIRSVRNNTNSKDGHILKANINRQGYKALSLSRQGKTKLRRVNRLVAQAFTPNPKNKPQVNHKNGLKTDNRVENLEWATNSENLKHAYRVIKTKSEYGEKNPQAKLTNKDVFAILEILSTKKYLHKEIAKKFGVTPSVVSGIKTGRVWGHLTQIQYNPKNNKATSKEIKLLREVVRLAIEGLTECIIGCNGKDFPGSDCFPWVGQTKCQEYLEAEFLRQKAATNI